MNSKIILSVVAFTVIVIGAGIFLFANESKPKITGLDDFSKCLTAKGVVMYGAAWCSHCKATKALFGDSFKFVTYVECPAEPKKCEAEGVTGYPTWKFPNGQKLEGEQPLSAIAKAASCELVKDQK